MVNKVILLGNLGRDPEVRATQAGQTVANFSLATSRKWTNRETGEKHDETEWHKIVVWGRQAEIAGQYLVKGKKIYLEGRLQTREWTDRDDQKRYTTEIVCENFQMLGGREDGGGGRVADDDVPGPSSTEKSRMTGVSQGGAGAPPDEDDDIPF